MLLFAFLLVSVFQMSPQDKKQTGTDRLTSQEKRNLNRWIQRHYEVRKKTKSSPLFIEQIQRDGSSLILSDGSCWEIDPQDRLLAQTWLSSAELTIQIKGEKTFLTNNLTQTTLSIQNRS